MRTGVYTYPWDVVGDAGAAHRIAALGAQTASLAAAYHEVRALTPRHPRHRVVTAAHSAVYYPPGEDVWRGRRLRPIQADWVEADDAFAESSRELRRAGLAVYGWAVLLHNCDVGERHPDLVVRNAFGDLYPWALCPSQAETRDYASALVAELAGRQDLDGLELEAAGWYGVAHQNAHDKTVGARLTPAEEYLLSLCFCSGCLRVYADGGLAPAELQARVRRALQDAFTGGDRVPDEPTSVTVERAAGEGEARAVTELRMRVARQLRTEILEAVAAAGRDVPVTFDASACRYQTGANPGMDISDVVAAGARVSVSWHRDAESAARTTAAVISSGGAAVANVTALGSAGAPGRVRDTARRARAAGASEVWFYHAGVATDAELGAIGAAVASVGSEADVQRVTASLHPERAGGENGT